MDLAVVVTTSISGMISILVVASVFLQRRGRRMRRDLAAHREATRNG